MIQSRPNCPQCGQPIPADAPDGVCPRCIFDIGLSGDDHGATELHSKSQSKSGSPPFVAPTGAELEPSFPDLDVMELIGQGGMGAVYKVRQKNLDRIAALKIIPPDIDGDPSFAERFAREARALAKLTHPNIVMIFEFGVAGEFHYFLMEYIDGVTLREAMAERKLTAEQAIAIIPQICDALQFAHEEGIVHRDIKPENVLIDRRGRVRIADFGLAKLLRKSELQHSLTGTRQIMGTPHYMAPEQMENPLSVDHRADIYSLGVVFYELLTGELPIGRFDPPSQRAELNAQLDDVVLKSLEKEPARRYQHASEVKVAVSSIQNEKPPRAKPRESPPVQEPQEPPRTMFVPFNVEDEWGVTHCNGIIRCDGEAIFLEFEKKKPGALRALLKANVQEVRIPLSRVAEIKSRAMLRNRKIHLLTMNLELVNAIPSAESGRVVLQTSNDDAEAADRFVAAVAARLTGDSWLAAEQYARSQSPESLHPLAQTHVDRNKVAKKLSGPFIGMAALSVFNFALSLALGIVVWSDFSVLNNYGDKAPAELVRTPQFLEGAVLPNVIGVLAVAVLSLTLAGFQALCAWKLRTLDAWPIILASAIASMTPIHIGFVPGLIIGTITITAISNRHVRAAFYQEKYVDELGGRRAFDVQEKKPPQKGRN